ncbi:hypothetical protein KKH18_12355, partial [bacterium]|nr:hypothetical protein [bacterium]
LDTHNPAVRALRFASDQQSSLFEDSPARTRESEPNWLTPAPGSAIPHGIGLAMGRALHGAAGRTIVLTDNSSRWQSQLCNPLVTIMQQELKSLCVVVRMEKHDEAEWDTLQHQIISFGWRIHFCSDVNSLDEAYEITCANSDCPTVMICRFDEDINLHDAYLSPGIGVSDFPAVLTFKDQFDAIADALDIELCRLDLETLKYEAVELPETASSGMVPADLNETAGESLLQLAAEHKEIILLDASHRTSHYCGRFKQLYPERYLKDTSFRDTINTAAGLSEEDMLPVICATSALQFDLAHLPAVSRIVMLSLDAGLSAGMNGAGNPNLSDVASFNSRTKCEILHPCCAEETYSAMHYAIEEANAPSLIRVSGGKMKNSIRLPKDYYFRRGTGAILRKGKDALLFAYGPILLQKTLETAELLSMHDFDAAVVNLPWLNRVDLRWLRPLISSYEQIHVIDDHVSAGGLGDYLLHVCTENQLLQNRRFSIHGADGSDTILTGDALLRHHELDCESLAAEILKSAGEKRLSQRAQEVARSLNDKMKVRKSEESASAMLKAGLDILK